MATNYDLKKIKTNADKVDPYQTFNGVYDAVTFNSDLGGYVNANGELYPYITNAVDSENKGVYDPSKTLNNPYPENDRYSDYFSNKEIYESLKNINVAQAEDLFKIPSSTFSQLIDKYYGYDPYVDYSKEDPIQISYKIPGFQELVDQRNSARDKSFNSTVLTSALAFLGGVGALGGFGGAAAGAGEGAAVGGVDGAASGLGGAEGFGGLATEGFGASLDPLLSSAILADGTLTAAELAPILASESAYLGGAGGALAGSELGSGGFSPADLDYFNNFQFPSNDLVAPTIQPDLSLPQGYSPTEYFDAFTGTSFNPEYANISGGVEGPVNALGGSSTNLGDLFTFGTETGNYGPLAEKVYGGYNDYLKPISQANSASKLIGGGGSTGTGSSSAQPDAPLPQAAGSSVFQGGGGIAAGIGAGLGAYFGGSGFGGQQPIAGYPGFPQQGLPAPGGLPATPQFQPSFQQQQDPNTFIPEYLKRGVIRGYGR